MPEEDNQNEKGQAAHKKTQSRGRNENVPLQLLVAVSVSSAESLLEDEANA